MAGADDADPMTSGAPGDADTTDTTTATPDAGGKRAAMREGLVIARAPGLFLVDVAGQIFLCTLRGRLRKPPRPATLLTTRPPVGARRGARFTSPPKEQPSAQPEPAVRVAVGDRVLITPLLNGDGAIEEVLPRRNNLSRAKAEVNTELVMMANLDQAILVFATQQPEPNLRLLDRYLALCEHAHVPAAICFNKYDLGLPPEVEEAANLYALLGYPILFTSAKANTGVEMLRERLVGRVSLLTGPSGVGKSSLTNALLPEANQRVGEISQATGKGKHTTTGVRLLPLPGGGWLADSAGIRELALWNVPADELAETFVELRPFVDQCEYEDCEHGENEEGCALRDALATGAISLSRFASFEKLLEEARAEEAPPWAKVER